MEGQVWRVPTVQRGRMHGASSLSSLCFHHTRAQVGTSPGLELSVNLELSLDLVQSQDWGSAQGWGSVWSQSSAISNSVSFLLPQGP